MNCPSCGYSYNSEFLKSKDYFLTGESFSVHRCDSCGLLFTTPRPADDRLGSYYESPDYLSHNTGKVSFKSWVYDTIRIFNLSHKYKMIDHIRKPGKLLDYGCGTGAFLKRCQSSGWTGKGIEVNDKARDFAITQNQLEVYPEQNIQDFAEASFDLITLWHVLEHIPDLNQRLSDFYRLLKPGGFLLLAVPNSASWDAQHYGPLWAGWDLPRHLYHYNYKTLQATVVRHGFTHYKSMPLKIDAFYICLLSEQYRKNSFPWLLAFVNGWKSNLWATRHEKNYSSIISVFQKG